MKKIMLIDSDVEQLRTLDKGLSNSFQLLNCSRGEKALDLYRIFLPHALVLDPTTPGLPESGFLRSLRELPGGYRIPVLALTRIRSTRTLEDIFRWKVDVVLSKPCAAERAEKKLREMLAHFPSKPAPARPEPEDLLTSI
ncbi:MAG TPA: hypothetical protein VHE12_10125 [bacterium]|nr:hypothetical protein [bacterium]